MCFLSRKERKKLRNKKKFRKENLKEKIQRQFCTGKKGFTTKEKVSSNFSASLVNGRTAKRVLFHLTSSFGTKPLVTLD